MKPDQLKQIVDDPEFRKQALGALQSVKRTVDEVRAEANKPTKKAQKKLKKNKQQDQQKSEAVAAEVVDDAGQDAPVKKKKCCRRVRRLVFVAVIGTIIALVVSPDARKAFLDALFGAEEEFQYTSHVPGTNGTS
jgi:F0F1-type ATP synthase membrane subunit b/b'